MPHLIEKLNAIAAIPGRKAKAQLIADFTASELAIVQKALDPTVTYYIAKLDPVPADAMPGMAEWGAPEDKLLTDLATRALTGNDALEAVQQHMKHLVPNDAELLRRVILKDLRAGIGPGTINSVFPGTVPEFAYMRCSLPKDSKVAQWEWDKGVYSQLKANGMFARVAVTADSKVLVTTRQGNTFPDNAMLTLKDEASWTFGDETETHGELTVWRNGELLPRAEGNGMLNSVLQGAELEPDCEVRFDAWDQIPLAYAVPGGRYEMPYALRFDGLKEQVREASPKSIMIIEHKMVYSYAEAMSHYREMLARKLEGTVIKRPSMIWFDGDSQEQVKLKLEVVVDLKIIGFKPGTPGTRTAETFGALLCATADDLLEVSVAGFKRDLEQWLHEHREEALGMIVAVRANEISEPGDTNPKYSLYHPRVVELRRDKQQADTLQQVKDQFESATRG